MTNEPIDDDARERTRLRLFKAELLALAVREDFIDSAAVVIAGLLDCSEALMRRAVRLEPADLPPLLARIDAMRSHVAAVGARTSKAGFGRNPAFPPGKRTH